MNKVLIVVAVLVLFMVVAWPVACQTCTPFNVGASYETNGSGNGPNWEVEVDGTFYAAGQTATIHMNGRSGFYAGKLRTFGFVNIPANFGGCTLSSWLGENLTAIRIVDLSMSCSNFPTYKCYKGNVLFYDDHDPNSSPAPWSGLGSESAAMTCSGKPNDYSCPLDLTDQRNPWLQYCNPGTNCINGNGYGDHTWRVYVEEMFWNETLGGCSQNNLQSACSDGGKVYSNWVNYYIQP